MEDNRFLTSVYSYLNVVSWLIIAQVMYYAIQLTFSININDLLFATAEGINNTYRIIAISLFLFNSFNAIACAVASTILFIKRHRLRLAMLCLSAAALYYFYIRLIGSSF